jgi:hypothetical protein
VGRFFPETIGIFMVEGVGCNAAVIARAVRNDDGFVTVFDVTPADAFEQR